MKSMKERAVAQLFVIYDQNNPDSQLSTQLGLGENIVGRKLLNNKHIEENNIKITIDPSEVTIEDISVSNNMQRLMPDGSRIPFKPQKAYDLTQDSVFYIKHLKCFYSKLSKQPSSPQIENQKKLSIGAQIPPRLSVSSASNPSAQIADVAVIDDIEDECSRKQELNKQNIQEKPIASPSFSKAFQKQSDISLGQKLIQKPLFRQNVNKTNNSSSGEDISPSFGGKNDRLSSSFSFDDKKPDLKDKKQTMNNSERLQVESNRMEESQNTQNKSKQKLIQIIKSPSSQMEKEVTPEQTKEDQPIVKQVVAPVQVESKIKQFVPPTIKKNIQEKKEGNNSTHDNKKLMQNKKSDKQEQENQMVAQNLTNNGKNSKTNVKVEKNSQAKNEQSLNQKVSLKEKNQRENEPDSAQDQIEEVEETKDENKPQKQLKTSQNEQPQIDDKQKKQKKVGDQKSVEKQSVEKQNVKQETEKEKEAGKKPTPTEKQKAKTQQKEAQKSIKKRQQSQDEKEEDDELDLSGDMQVDSNPDRPKRNLYQVIFSNSEVGNDEQNLIRRLGAKVAESFDQNFNILVMDQFRRRIQLLLALNMKATIVSSDWVNACIQQRKLVETDKYILSVDTATQKKYNFDLKTSIKNSQANQEGVLNGLSFFVPVDQYFENVSEEELDRLVFTAGGTVIKELPSEKEEIDSDLYILSNPQSRDVYKRYADLGYKVCDLELVLAACLRQELEIQKFMLSQENSGSSTNNFIKDPKATGLAKKSK